VSAGRRRLLTAAGAGLAGLLLVACGVPVDRSPSALPRNAIPFGLLQPSAPSTTTTTGPAPARVTVKVFLVTSAGRLAVVNRELPSDQQSLAAVLESLVAGPTNVEAAAGLLSAVPAQTTVLGATVGAGGMATVNFGGPLGQDILWRHYVTGENAVWQMADTTITGFAYLITVTDTNWQIVGVGDFNGINGEGTTSILWRHAVTGNNAVWFLDGTTFAGGANLPAVSDTNWQIAGTE